MTSILQFLDQYKISDISLPYTVYLYILFYKMKFIDNFIYDVASL